MNIATVDGLLDDLAYELRVHCRPRIAESLNGWVEAYYGTIWVINNLTEEVTGKRVRPSFKAEELSLQEVTKAEHLIELLGMAIDENDQPEIVKLVKRLRPLFIKA